MSGHRILYQHARGQPHCEVEGTRKEGQCEEWAEVMLDGLLLCERHARQLRLEGQLWTVVARGRGREDIVLLLETERARVVSALDRVREELERSGGIEDQSGRAILLYGIRSSY
jgi:hypothetical protein